MSEVSLDKNLNDHLFLFSENKNIYFLLYDLKILKKYYKLYSDNFCKIAFNDEKIYIDEKYLFDFFLTDDFLTKNEKIILLKEFKLASFLKENLVIFDISKLNYYINLV